MPSLNEISQAIAEYQSGPMSLDEFADWFRANSRGMFGESKEVLEACLSIEQAFSRFDFEGISEDAFRLELANAIRPFVSPRVYALPQRVVFGIPLRLTASSVRPFVEEVALA